MRAGAGHESASNDAGRIAYDDGVTSPFPAGRVRPFVSALRLVFSATTLLALGTTYARASAAGDPNPFNYFGYFTNLTSTLTSLVLLGTALRTLRGRHIPGWLLEARGVATACMLIVGVVYNTLVPGTGSAPPAVNAWLHIVFPLYVALDWLLVADRHPLPWRRLWVVLPYPVTWLGVVLVRGATDGWVPYGFLLPETGAASISAHAAGPLGGLLLAGIAVWAASRFPRTRPAILHSR